MNRTQLSTWKSILIQYAGRYKKAFLLLFILLFLTTGFEMVIPYLTKVAVDEYILPGKIEQGWWVVLVFVITLIGQGVSQYFRTFLMGVTAQKIMQDIRYDLFQHILSLPYSFFTRVSAGKLVTRVLNDVEALQELMSQGLITIVADILTSVMILGVLFWLSPWLGLLVLLSTPLVLILSGVFRKYAERAQQQIRRQLAHLNTVIQEHVSGMDILKLYSGEKTSQNHLEQASWNYSDANIRAVVHYAWYYPAIRSVEIFVTVLILLTGAWFFYRGQVTIGTLIAFLQYIRRLFEPIADLSDKFQTFLSSRVALDHIAELFSLPSDPLDSGQTHTLPSCQAIALKHVWFRYEKGSHWVLQDFSCHLPHASKTGLIGPSGSGKSTLMKLLLKLYPVDKGDIMWNSTPLSELPGPLIRKRIGIAFQDPFFFSMNIKDNIVLDRGPESEARLEKLLATWRHLEPIALIQSKLHEHVAENGKNLSQSEKQLIALLRALVHDPDIIIFDEAMSSLDVHTESALHTIVEHETKNKTLIIIAHRLTGLRNVNYLMILNEGKVVEEGHPDRLAQNPSSLYARLIEFHRVL